MLTDPDDTHATIRRHAKLRAAEDERDDLREQLGHSFKDIGQQLRAKIDGDVGQAAP